MANRKRLPNIISVLTVVKFAATCQAGLPDGRYVPARPLGWQSWIMRFKAAWLVFTGRADALTWPGQ
jgi:hypothetical protein